MESVSSFSDKEAAAIAHVQQHDNALLEAGKHVVGATAELIKSADPDQRRELVDELKGQLREAGVEVTDIHQEESEGGLSREERRLLFLEARANTLRGRKSPAGKRPPAFGRLL